MNASPAGERDEPEIARAPADCRHCAVCCFSEKPDYVRVTGDDWTRLGAHAAQLAHFLGTRAFMRMREGHCIALEEHRSPDGGVEYACSVYAQRPQICRDLTRGSAHCLGELSAKAAAVADRKATKTVAEKQK